jgi:hypothetical protein
MISPVSPNDGLILVPKIEEALVLLNCTKVTYGNLLNCMWQAPNGRLFHAPNPLIHKMVPADTLSGTICRLAAVMRLSPRPA